jgi:hypothetical protein
LIQRLLQDLTGLMQKLKLDTVIEWGTGFDMRLFVFTALRNPL